jgi:hypothetical protein
MDSPYDPSAPEMRKTFPARSPSAARVAASMWLNDFRQHGPLRIRSIRVIGDDDRFEAVVTYSEMKPVIPEGPRLSPPSKEPLLKSA